ncbi:Intradiol ring-cleavage dioxygenase [Penicillium ucsense]|uniref:Intradiol ring-cleavage dioxygenase n=1 Tax=Penicillium ucsense TaxID=2839758 RepID=A0A8J8WLF9_9EURO|nr:Intradiol ring-cleavage dioxygenase [Penicillium ucsense]KAF7734934.1 Intradiol ring-cleavage dioxygenase [Penicillium ucsense]
MSSSTNHRFDPTFTDQVVNAMGPKTPERVRVILGSLIRHIHDFAREVELTPAEWMTGVEFINSIGAISTPIRNEGHRICDVIGLESLVDEIANKIVTEQGLSPTSNVILGPFWSPNAPFRALGDSIIQDPLPNGRVTYMHGRLTDMETGKPIVGAVLDIWQASANAKYDFQDPEQSENNLRGKFRSNENGDFYWYCYHPTAYSLPTDGPAGVLLNLMDRSPMRPAHIHLMITHPDYATVINQIYPSTDPHLEIDSVFAVKDDLVVDFKPKTDDPKAELDLEYNVRMALKKHHPHPNSEPPKSSFERSMGGGKL